MDVRRASQLFRLMRRISVSVSVPIAASNLARFVVANPRVLCSEVMVIPSLLCNGDCEKLLRIYIIPPNP